MWLPRRGVAEGFGKGEEAALPSMTIRMRGIGDVIGIRCLRNFRLWETFDRM